MNDRYPPSAAVPRTPAGLEILFRQTRIEVTVRFLGVDIGNERLYGFPCMRVTMVSLTRACRFLNSVDAAGSAATAEPVSGTFSSIIRAGRS